MAQRATTSANLLLSTGSRALTEEDALLVDKFISTTAWVFSPYVGESGQETRFRKVYTIPTDRGPPSNATVIFATDNRFILYAHGVEVQSLRFKTDSREVLAYSFTFPVGDQQYNSSFVLAFQVVGSPGRFPALRALVQVNFQNSKSSDLFETGIDPGWFGEEALLDDWEQPWFQAPDGAWHTQAVLRHYSGYTPEAIHMWQREVVEFGRLPAADNASNSNCHCQALTSGKLAGVLAGSMIAALVLGALGAWLLMRKKLQEARKGISAPGEMVETPHSGLHAPHQASSVTTSKQPGNTPSAP
ncbi:hypothetical protein DFP72DRAFT_839290 [Ephemerocybe angulata]|uniref:Uncharacterized protein n=1 Tax=Ephemerocybe angulata TaxID=980116 RepID=A0A8H6MGX5_9AGAR|nr:hypothetical protein DFP72DRAFT_839290 [Tulosesus angulatus]